LTITYASWRMQLMSNRERDAYYLSDVAMSFEEIGSIPLMGS
jgi:hypothetical protein